MKKKILIAEDDDINYKLIFELVKNDNIEVLWAKNGDEAVKLYKENPDITAILMDIRMPVKTGDIAAKEIKEINQNVPIIAVSAYDKSQECLYFDSYIQKPVYQNNLFSAIETHIKNVLNKIVEKNKELIDTEQKTIEALTGVSEILELTEYINKSHSNEILEKLDEIKDILRNKN